MDMIVRSDCALTGSLYLWSMSLLTASSFTPSTGVSSVSPSRRLARKLTQLSVLFWNEIAASFLRFDSFVKFKLHSFFKGKCVQ